MQSQERQSVAREQRVAERRGVTGGDSSDEDSALAGRNLPKVDLGHLISSHSALESDGNSVDSSIVLKEILGVVINMYAKSEGLEKVKKLGEENAYRISQLEAKVGRPEDIALPLGLAVRHLPLPCEGVSELENVRMALREVNAPGVDVNKEVVKAIRVGFKAESEAGANNANLGTVKVEMRTEESRASVMKNKYTLKNHPQMVMKRLVIQNLKSREEMKYENFNYDILKMVTNSEDYYIGGNGHIRKKDQNTHSQRSFPPRPPYNQNQPQHVHSYQAQTAPPPKNQYQRPPPGLRQYAGQHQPRSQFHGAPVPGFPPQPGTSIQHESSLLDTDIDSIFTFDPIKSYNPFKAPPALNAPPSQPAQQDLGAHGHVSGQEQQVYPAQGNQVGE